VRQWLDTIPEVAGGIISYVFMKGISFPHCIGKLVKVLFYIEFKISIGTTIGVSSNIGVTQASLSFKH
jgi:hypothetical protein